nr:hypothetical protein OG999_24035 [Streptomyces sp. NBC_00886]
MRQQGRPLGGHQFLDRHVRVVVTLRQFLQRVPLGGEGVPGRRGPGVLGRGGATGADCGQVGAATDVVHGGDLFVLLPVAADAVRDPALRQPRP